MAKGGKPPLPFKPVLPLPKPSLVHNSLIDKNEAYSTQRSQQQAIVSSPKQPIPPPRPPRPRAVTNHFIKSKSLDLLDDRLIIESTKDISVVNNNNTHNPLTVSFSAQQYVKPLSERPLPRIPLAKSEIVERVHVSPKDERRQGVLLNNDFNLNMVLSNNTNLTNGSNLNKLKSISSPTLFHREDEEEEKEFVYRNMRSDIIFENDDDFIDEHPKSTDFQYKKGGNKKENMLLAVPNLAHKFMNKRMKGMNKWHSLKGIRNIKDAKNDEFARKRAETDFTGITTVDQFVEVRILNQKVINVLLRDFKKT